MFVGEMLKRVCQCVFIWILHNWWHGIQGARAAAKPSPSEE